MYKDPFIPSEKTNYIIKNMLFVKMK